MRSTTYAKKLKKSHTIHFLDVGRGLSIHEITLNQAHHLRVDLFLKQELNLSGY